MLISKIRKYSYIAVIAVAISLIGFLVKDMTNSNTGIFAKNRTPDFASIDGKDVSQADFSARKSEGVLEYLTFNNYLLQQIQGQYQMDAQTEFAVGEQAWNDFVQETLMDKQLSKLGLYVTDEEFSDIIYGPDPHPVIKNYYIGLSKTGQYDASLLPNWVSQISSQENQQQNPQIVAEYYQFACREKVAKRDYAQGKFNDLFAKSVYIPQWMVKRNYNQMNTRASFTFTSLPYTQIADSTITVSDGEMKNYYNAHKNKFKQTEGRIIEYVSWEFIPTSADSATTLKSLNESIAKMKDSKNDSLFIVTRSEDEDKYGRSTYSREDLYAKAIDSTTVNLIFTDSVGSLVGPFLNAGFYKAAKIKSRNNMPDSVDARHILVSVNETRDSVKAKFRADSIFALLSAGGDFAALAKANSDDQGSAEKGGDLGWSTPAVNFVPELKDYLFKTGTEHKPTIVKTQFGYHIIEIKEIKKRKDFVNVVFLSKEIQPGKKTIDSLDRLAGGFYDNHQTVETFDKGVTEMRLMKHTSQPLQKNQYEVPGVSNSREIITWAFDSEKDQFKYFNMSERIVVAYVKEIRVNGIADLENVREQVEQEVITEKKGEMLTKKFTEAMEGVNSLEGIALKLHVGVDSAQNASMGTPYAAGIGLEPKVVGSIFSTELGKISKPIVGNRGVYLIKTGEITPAPATEDYSLNTNQLTYAWQNKASAQSIITELKDKADVVDNRYKFGN